MYKYLVRSLCIFQLDILGTFFFLLYHLNVHFSSAHPYQHNKHFLLSHLKLLLLLLIFSVSTFIDTLLTFFSLSLD